MTPNEYQKQAARTICPQDRVLERLGPSLDHGLGLRDSGAQLLHGVLGITGEVGELAGAVERYAYYQRALDLENVVEELGDSLWYIAEICSAMNITMEEVMEKNIRKLKARFPHKFDHSLAKEENRDREREARAMDDGVFYD